MLTNLAFQDERWRFSCSSQKLQKAVEIFEIKMLPNWTASFWIFDHNVFKCWARGKRLLQNGCKGPHRWRPQRNILILNFEIQNILLAIDVAVILVIKQNVLDISLAARLSSSLGIESSAGGFAIHRCKLSLPLHLNSSNFRQVSPRPAVGSFLSKFKPPSDLSLIELVELWSSEFLFAFQKRFWVASEAIRSGVHRGIRCLQPFLVSIDQADFESAALCTSSVYSVPQYSSGLG